MGQSNPENYKSNMRDEKEKLRNQQKEKDISKELRYFIETICKANENEKRFFLQWCQLELNKMSDKILPSVLR